ncbi:MAG: hypothetical protein J1E41_01640 [Ruminococcus sp.]|nr:hypothetical protein [Ruminococcus sp.]
MGKCIDCIYMKSMGGLDICANENSSNFGEYTGICCEDECEDCVEEYNGDII